MVSELSSGTYKNSGGSEIAVIKIANDVLMTSKEMAKIYGVGIPVISKKLKRIFSVGGLNKKQVSSILTHKADDGKLYRTTYYNSQVIILVGTMLKSPEAESFQKWLGNKQQKFIS
ncbi:MAG: hypothetical protein LBI63_06470 [Candidatus Ancillula sp.]|nr:hypothetical protein [Candidatus Ancillula sp.]